MTRLARTARLTDVAKRKQSDTTVPPLPGGFEKALEALLRTPAPPKNLGRPKPKTKGSKKR